MVGKGGREIRGNKVTATSKVGILSRCFRQIDLHQHSLKMSGRGKRKNMIVYSERKLGSLLQGREVASVGELASDVKDISVEGIGSPDSSLRTRLQTMLYASQGNEEKKTATGCDVTNGGAHERMGGRRANEISFIGKGRAGPAAMV